MLGMEDHSNFDVVGALSTLHQQHSASDLYMIDCNTWIARNGDKWEYRDRTWIQIGFRGHPKTSQ